MIFTDLGKNKKKQEEPRKSIKEMLENEPEVEVDEKPVVKKEIKDDEKKEESLKKSYRILVAEDEESLTNAFSIKLRAAGFQIDIARDGNEVIKMIKENKYDLILLDLLMPNKDGFEVLKELKLLKNPPEVIVLSNLSQEEDIEKTKDLGAIDFWIKSNFQLSQIVEFLKDYFDKK